MQFATIEEARHLSGMRLVVTRGSWALWSEFAKNICHIKGIAFTAVAHEGFGDNPELVAWTGVRNQPQAIWESEPVRSGWLEILNLAERIAPEPRLLPEASVDRADVVGLSNEICGEGGIGWCRRIQIAAEHSFGDLGMKRMREHYGLDDSAVTAAQTRVADILRNLAARMQAQRKFGRDYLVGEQLSALDVYWACVSNLVRPLPHEQCPMDEGTRYVFGNPGDIIEQAIDPVLIEHRDLVYRRHLIFPVTFE